MLLWVIQGSVCRGFYFSVAEPQIPAQEASGFVRFLNLDHHIIDTVYASSILIYYTAQLRKVNQMKAETLLFPEYFDSTVITPLIFKTMFHKLVTPLKRQDSL